MKDFISNEWLQKLIDYVIVAVIAIAGFYATISATITTVKEIKPKVEQHDLSIVEMRTDIKYIKEGIDEIKRAVK